MFNATASRIRGLKALSWGICTLSDEGNAPVSLAGFKICSFKSAEDFFMFSHDGHRHRLFEDQGERFFRFIQTGQQLSSGTGGNKDCSVS